MTEQKTEAELAAEQKATEEAKVEAEAKAKADKEAQDAEFEATLDDLTDEEKEVKSTERQKAQNPDKKIDYKAELEKEKEKTKKAEDALATKRIKKSKQNREGLTEEEIKALDEEEKPLTKSELEVILKEERQASRKEDQREKVDEIIKSMIDDEDAIELMKLRFKSHTPTPGQTLREQLEDVFMLVNKKKIIGENSELKRALKNKDNVSTSATNTKHSESKESEPKIAPDVKLVLTQGGYAYNTTAKRYERTLPNGKVLFKDPKTGKILPA